MRVAESWHRRPIRGIRTNPELRRARAEAKSTAAGLANGILLMLVIPYGLMATFAYIVYRSYRKRLKERQQNAYTYQSESGR